MHGKMILESGGPSLNHTWQNEPEADHQCKP
jgi:hypothetical protein